jgi:hypothetical protein
MKSQKGSKDMYHILNSNSIKLKCEEKWTEALNVILHWKRFHKKIMMFGISGPFSFSKSLIGIFDFLM